MLHKPRNHTLDYLRGFTIIAMVIFHFSFDLYNFHVVDIDIRHGVFWKYFRYTIVSSFVFIMGYSLVLTYGKELNTAKLVKRFLTLLGLGFVITFATYFIFEHSWIYFGILHFMAFATLIGVLFVRLPWVSLLLGIFILMGYNLDFLTVRPALDYLRPLLHLPDRTEDLVLFVPWLAPMFIGIFAGHFKLIPSGTLFNGLKPVKVLGQHSLLIYMAHQPILFGSMLVLHFFKLI